MKATATAPSNIAFIKYWGRKDEELKLPANGSISMNLSGLTTTTTVEFSNSFHEDSVTINGVEETKEKIITHLNRLRKLAGISSKAKVVSENNFPRGTGLSSSASGFAALTLAGACAAGLDLSEKELSILARQGSGSACRSIPDGFVEWMDGNTSETSYAVSLYPVNYWDVVSLAVILTDQVKDVSTTEGQMLAPTSLFFETRQRNINKKIEKIKKAIHEKDFQTFGEIAEAEALEMHAIMLTSHPSLIYWYPATITMMKSVKMWRSEGINCYFTLNTGQNIHILCTQNDVQKIIEKLKESPEVREVIENHPSDGVKIIPHDLF